MFIFKRCTPHRNNSIIFFVILFQLVNVAYNYDGRSNCPLVMLWNRERDRKTWKINGKNYYQINSINMSERNRKETENVNIIKWMTEWKLHFFCWLLLLLLYVKIEIDNLVIVGIIEWMLKCAAHHMCMVVGSVIFMYFINFVCDIYVNAVCTQQAYNDRRAWRSDMVHYT